MKTLDVGMMWTLGGNSFWPHEHPKCLPRNSMTQGQPEAIVVTT